MNIVGEYIKYLLNSKGKHKIHSPYVFDFITKCLTTQTDPVIRQHGMKLKKVLRKNEQSLKVNDAGQGSKKLKEERTVREIFQSAASKGVYADLLYQLVKYYPLQQVLELGTSLGVGTFYLASGNPDCKVVTVDACEETQEMAKKNLTSLGIRNVDYVNSTFQAYFDEQRPVRFDLVFIDGHHNGMALRNYLDLLEVHMHDETILLIDDIRWSDDMFETWNDLVVDERYHLSIDLFRMGILVKRQHQAKEHFVLKLKGVLKGMM